MRKFYNLGARCTKGKTFMNLSGFSSLEDVLIKRGLRFKGV